MTVERLGNAYQTYRRTAASRSVISLLVANAVPLVGVLFFGWSLLTILVIYWLENGIVGLWNLPRIALARGVDLKVLPELPDDAAYAATGSPQAAYQLKGFWERARAAQLAALERAKAGRLADGRAAPGTSPMAAVARMSGLGGVALAIFFATHYGIFWFVHGVFVFALPTFGGGMASGDGDPFGQVVWSNVALAAAALFLSHGASFLFNYIGRGEYLTSSPARQMAAPYGRVIVLHLTILFGAFAIAIIGAPIGALLLLVGLKTAFDLGLHLREHRAAEPTPQLPGGVAGPV